MLKIGVNLLSLLEQIHSMGYVHNNLKLEHILINNYEKSSKNLDAVDKIRLIDYTNVTKFLDES